MSHPKRKNSWLEILQPLSQGNAQPFFYEKPLTTHNSSIELRPVTSFSTVRPEASQTLFKPAADPVKKAAQLNLQAIEMAKYSFLIKAAAFLSAVGKLLIESLNLYSQTSAAVLPTPFNGVYRK